MDKSVKNKGFIQLIIVLVIALIILSLLGYSLLDITQDEQVQENFSFVWNFLNWLWDNYLQSPVKIAWRLWIELLWEPFVEAMRGVESGETPVPGGNSI